MKSGFKIHSKMILAGLVLALLVSGCAFSRNALISSWKEAGSGLTMIFTPEGKLRLLPPPATAGTAASAPAEISYRFINDTTIAITPAQVLGLTENVPIPFNISGDTLTMQFNGQPVTLTRVP